MNALRAKAEAADSTAATPPDQRSRAAASHLTVAADHAGQRLDNFLQGRLRGLPKALIYRIIRTGEVRVNGGRSKAEHKLAAGDDVRLPPLALAAGSAGPRTMPATALRGFDAEELAILHEDDVLIAIDKPAGLAVHGGSGVAAGLIERLRASRPAAPFLELVHRLDRDTSGVLLVAKSRPALLALHRALARGAATKHYRAWVKGYWGRSGASLLQFPLQRYVAADGERRVRVAAGGQAAATRVRRITQLDSTGIAGLPPALSLLDCELLTGRTHQIRVHLAQAGFPLLGDQKYGDFTLNKKLEKSGHKRMFLHAFTLSIEHPSSGLPVRFESPLPAAFQRLAEDVGRWRNDDGNAAVDGR
ncbi:MAG: RluA family pseudouridine synthase [Lautropia sp.]